MRTTRIYINTPLAPGTSIQLPEHAGSHLIRVLRLGDGDECVLFNGDGHDYRALLSDVGKRGARAEVMTRSAVCNESSLRITLLQGIARGEKMDLILQKATELGVATFIPVHSERSEVRLDGARAEKRLAHWLGVVTSACEQSGRAFVPEVAAPVNLAQALATNDLPSLRCTLSPEGKSGIHGLTMPDDRGLLIAVGPEGGWGLRDLKLLDDAGFIGLRLGPRILRTETAGLAAIAALQLQLGDFA